MTPWTRQVLLRHSLSLLTSTTALPATLLAILPVFFLPLNPLKLLSSSLRRPLSRTCVPKGLSRRDMLSLAILWVNILPLLPLLMSSIYLLLSMSSSTMVLLCSVLLNTIFKLCYVCCESLPCSPNSQRCCFTYDFNVNQFVASNRQLQHWGMMILFVTRKLILITAM